ncbi:protein Star-like [Homarus americanus]|uniref:Star-like 9 n=1 Tax=Homarus americanus TaxID=6706 RepID=A0A8J5K6A5_HOMAM|nr:protein Star-like [Homarus americanus]KAG7170326.1 Star-like 9 [Homarus americanus]
MARPPKELCVLVFIPAVMFPWVFFQQESSTRWDKVAARLSGPLAGDDPRVLQVVTDTYLDPPSTLPYNLSTNLRYSTGKDQFTWPWIHHFLQLLFSEQRGGFFVEAGALDGEYLSNTLWLEQELGWTGLLIEADVINYKALRDTHRRAWSSNTCLSSELYPKDTLFVSRFTKIQTNLSPWAARSHGHELRDDVNQSKHDILDDTSYSTVQCLPLVSYLAALTVSSVDLLSLDIQGTEAFVIRNFLTSSNITIRVIVAENEYNQFDDEFMSLMRDKGYVVLAAAIDYVFVRRDDSLMTRPEVQRLLLKTNSSKV